MQKWDTNMKVGYIETRLVFGRIYKQEAIILFHLTRKVTNRLLDYYDDHPD